MAKALQGVTVLDFGRIIAGPFCAYLLRELGAEVIKIEMPGGGETLRTLPPLTKGGEGYSFIILNRGKKSITLNLETEKGREISGELIRKADILVENFSFKVIDRLGLNYELIREMNPGLIHASITGFGHTGPRSSQFAVDIVAQAMGGLMSVTGFQNNPPTRAGISLGDFLAGINAVVGILAALYYREKTGEGQHIDISMQDCMWSIVAVEHLPRYYISGPVLERGGNTHPGVTPAGTFLAKDGYVIIWVVTVSHWEHLLEAIGRTDLIGLKVYATQNDRIKCREDVEALVADWVSNKTVTEIMENLGKFEVPCSIVPTFEEVVNEPQILSRDMLIEVEQIISGRLKVPGSAFKLTKTPGEAGSPAPFLGEHNYEIYSNLLGYTEEYINKLQDEGVI